MNKNGGEKLNHTAWARKTNWSSQLEVLVGALRASRLLGENGHSGTNIIFSKMSNIELFLVLQFIDYLFAIQHTLHGWIFGHRWEALDVRALRLRRLLHSSYKRSNLSTRGDRISGSRPTSPSWTFSKGSQCCSSALECLRITLQASGVPRAYPFAGKGEDRQKDREATLHIAEATLGMHSNYRTSRYPLLKTMVAVHNYPGSFSENILNVKR